MEELKELGKALYSLANMLIVLSFINIYLQKESISIFAVIIFSYSAISLYAIGFLSIRRGRKEDE